MWKPLFDEDEEDKDLPDKTGIDWLDAALSLAAYIIALTLKEIDNPRLAESG